MPSRTPAAYHRGAGPPERALTVVKALDLLKRFSEAERQARLMLRLYPATQWTEQAERRVLATPTELRAR